MGLGRIIRKIKEHFGRPRKRKPLPTVPRRSSTTTTTTTTAVTLATSTPLTLTTICQNDSTSSGVVVTLSDVEKSGFVKDMEMLSLTETMSVVGGVVAFIILMILMCFVYRTKCRTQVRMRKTGAGERRSGALSLDLMELDEYDQRIRQTAGLRPTPAFNSPVYGREEDSTEIPIINKQQVSTNDNTNVEQTESSVTNEYCNVVFDKKTQNHPDPYEDLDSDINQNDLSTRKMDSFKGKRTKPPYENLKPINGIPFAYTGDAVKGKPIDDILENFHEVDSVDLSSPPPTPCSERSYVNSTVYVNEGINLSSGYINEVEDITKGYVNTDYREQCMPLIEQEEEALQQIKLNNQTDKTQKIKNFKVQQSQSGPYKVTTEIDSDTEYNEENGYLAMDSKRERDTDYMPMDCTTNDNEDSGDNMYIYMDNCDSTGSYMNCSLASSVYENP